MTPIISPWWFYFFNLISNLRDVSFIVIPVIGFICFAHGMYTLMDKDSSLKGFIPTSLMKIVLVICLIFSIILPSNETMYQMAAASLITPNNITSTTDFVTDTINAIVDAVDEALED